MSDQSPTRPLFGTDTLLLLAMLFPVLFVGGGVMRQFTLTSAVAYGLTLVYLLVDVLGGDHDTYRLRRALVWSTIGVVVVAPALLFILLRHAAGPQYWVHDNPLQIEEAARMLVHGIDPYGQDYSKTPMALWSGYGDFRWSANPHAVPPPDWKVNPALFHVVSLPFGLLVAVPFYVLSTQTLGWFDARVVYVLAYLLVLWLIVGTVRNREQRLQALILVGLNPLLVPFLIEGRNDILVFALLLSAAAAWQRDRRMLAGLLVGLAITTKHTAIFFLPFYMLLGWRTELPWRARIRTLAYHLLAPGLTALALVLPFLLWNARSFVDDTYRYLAGTLATSYPLEGIGLSDMAVELGWVPNAAAPFPNALIQALTAGPLLAVLLWRQWRTNTMRQALFGHGAFLLVYMWSSRLFNDNYLGYIVLVLLVARYWPAVMARAPEPAPTPARQGLPGAGAGSLALAQAAGHQAWQVADKEIMR